VYATPNPRRSYRRRRRSYRANPPRRRRRYYGRRRYRRNPPVGIFGITFPSAQTIVTTTAGFLAPPFIEGFAMRFLPTQLTSNVLGKYLVKTASVALVVMGVRQFVGRDAGRYAMLGGVTYLGASLVSDFLPQLTARATLAPVGAGYYSPGSLGAQPLLGEYFGAYADSVPERLRPQTRF
jgi:hypothetical protein